MRVDEFSARREWKRGRRIQRYFWRGRKGGFLGGRSAGVSIQCGPGRTEQPRRKPEGAFQTDGICLCCSGCCEVPKGVTKAPFRATSTEEDRAAMTMERLNLEERRLGEGGPDGMVRAVRVGSDGVVQNDESSD